MGLLDLFMVAFMPPLQVLLIATLGAFLATDYCGVFPADGRRNLNKLVFYVFTPCMIFANLAKTITFQDIISWWFMPVNIGIIFLCGSVLGWLSLKILRPEKHLEGLIVAVCSAGNLGNLMVVIIPAVCEEKGSPFGNPATCRSLGLSYVSFSMALGGFYIWTHTYGLIKKSAAVLTFEGSSSTTTGSSDSQKTFSLPGSQDSAADPLLPVSTKTSPSVGAMIHHVLKELIQPPSFSALVGLIVGAVPWLKSLLVGEAAPLRVLQDSDNLLGDGTIPSVMLILGGNLVKGTRKSRLRPSVVVAVMAVRYVMLPVIGVGVVKGASKLGLLPTDPLFSYALMTQFTLPPAMSIGTMAELFKVGQEECSYLFLWSYLVAAVALTFWSTVYMWILA